MRANYHGCLTIPSQAVLENARHHRVAVWDVEALSTRLVMQRHDNLLQVMQRNIDVAGLLKDLSINFCFAGAL